MVNIRGSCKSPAGRFLTKRMARVAGMGYNMRAILPAALLPGRITDIRLFGILRRHTNERLATIPAAPGSHDRCGHIDGISWYAVPVGGPPGHHHRGSGHHRHCPSGRGVARPQRRGQQQLGRAGSWGLARDKGSIVVPVNDWRGRNPVHSLDAMIHDASYRGRWIGAAGSGASHTGDPLPNRYPKRKQILEVGVYMRRLLCQDKGRTLAGASGSPRRRAQSRAP